jgi:hypothetical protein
MMMDYFLFIVVVSLPLLLLAKSRDWLFQHTGKGIFFWILAFPGVAIHEFSHALMVFLVGYKINRVQFFAPAADGTLGFVEYSYIRTWYSPILRYLIGIAPLFGGLVSTFLVTWLFVPSLLDDNSIDSIRNAALAQPGFFACWLFLVCSIIANSVPSRVDMRNSYLGLALTILLICFIPLRFSILAADIAPILVFYMAVALLLAVLALSLRLLSIVK